MCNSRGALAKGRDLKKEKKLAHAKPFTKAREKGAKRLSRLLAPVLKSDLIKQRSSSPTDRRLDITRNVDDPLTYETSNVFVKILSNKADQLWSLDLYLAYQDFGIECSPSMSLPKR